MAIEGIVVVLEAGEVVEVVLAVLWVLDEAIIIIIITIIVRKVLYQTLEVVEDGRQGAEVLLEGRVV